MNETPIVCECVCNLFWLFCQLYGWQYIHQFNMMTRCGSKVNGNKNTQIEKRERQKKTAACVKSMQISLNEQWPLNLNISMTIHMYRIVSWYVLTLYWSVQWISSQHQHRHTHTKIWTFQKCKTGRMYAPLQKVKRTNKRTISIQWRWDACYWSVRSIIFMILCVHENGMHHVSFKPNQTKQKQEFNI